MAKNSPATITPADQVKQKMAVAAADMVRPETSAEEMALAILNATSIDDILGSTIRKMNEVEGSFLVVGANLNESDFQEGLGAYAVLDTLHPDGTRVLVTSGATNVVAQLVAMHAGSHFPQWVKFKSDTTKAGFTVWKLVKGDGAPPTEEQLAMWGENF